MQNLYKKNIPCLNCNKYGHEQKFCDEPITSFGVILVKTNDEISKHFNIDLRKYDNIDGFQIMNKSDLMTISKCMQSTKFLLVRRKHSLGFAEFIRGKYVVGNIMGIRALFNQMVQEELDMIRDHNFDELWEYFWGKNDIKRDYNDSKEKFDKLKSKCSVECDLDFYVDNANPNYKFPEWGFPKGRKKRGETDLECALREFVEETEIDLNDIKILENVKPIIEDLTGTNGIKYRHVYFLAEMTKNVEFTLDVNNKQSEIGDINFFLYDECINLLRDYHIEKKNILRKVLNYYIEISRTEQKKITVLEWKV
jgi:ADP-ribose pyrophosphatase YjhB (NUDIX family)